MERLRGSDTGFLFVETPTQTSVCVDLLELAPVGGDAAPLTVLDLQERVRARLHLLPSWRWRIQQVPLRIDHPVWVDDADFRIEDHIRHRVLPAPGGPEALDALMAEIEPQLLDLRHPLWQIILVDGLGGPGATRQALVFRFHHSLCDGAALLHSLDLLLGDAAGEIAAPDHLPPLEPVPTRRRLFRDAARSQGRKWKEIPSLVRDTRAIFNAVDERREVAEAPVPKSMDDAPATILNRPGPAVRTYGRTRLPMDTLHAIRKRTGATFNDVALAVVAGALRGYLLDRGELPAASLVANCPVSGDPPGTPPRQWGNRFANFFALLHTDVEDPVERLRAISSSTAEAKVQLEILGHYTLTGWLDRIPPFVGRRAARWMVDRNAKDDEKADSNAVVSNVRITAEDWRVGSQRVSHVYLSGPIGDDAGLNVTVVSFDGDLHVTINASPVAIADPQELIDRFHAALDELDTCTA